MKKVLKIVSISSEVAPFSKAGGLADVARSLPRALKHLDHEVMVITPLYGIIDPKKYNLKSIATDVPIQMDEKNIRKVTFWKGELMQDLPIYFVDNPKYFSSHKSIYRSSYENTRFLFFNLAAINLLILLKFKPDIIQCHEWHTGLIPYFIKKRFSNNPLFEKAALIFTIHNLAFQFGQNWWKVPPEKKDDGHSSLPNFSDKEIIEHINFAKRGIIYADLINTVSEQYAQEIMTPKFGQALHKILKNRRDRLFGIINGIDYDDYNPATDPGLYRKYDINSLEKKIKNKKYVQKKFGLPVNTQIPLIGMVSRITEQKGFELLMEIIEPLLRQELQLVVLGAGDKKYERFFRKITKKYPKKVAAHLEFNTQIATLTYAASDMFLMPSRFEPSGLGQLISSRYGSIPIVHATGGLVDTIQNFNPRTHRGNGFVFKTYDSRDLLVAITRALETYRYPESWRMLMMKAMQQSSSWEIPAKKYVSLFQKALRNKK